MKKIIIFTIIGMMIGLIGFALMMGTVAKIGKAEQSLSSGGGTGTQLTDTSWVKGDENLNLTYQLIVQGKEVCGRSYTPECIFNKDTLEKNMKIEYEKEWMENITDYKKECTDTKECVIENKTGKDICFYPQNCKEIITGSHLEPRCGWFELKDSKTADKEASIGIADYYDISSGSCHLVWKQSILGKDAKTSTSINTDILKTQFTFASDKSVDVVPSITLTDSKSKEKFFEMKEMAWWTGVAATYKNLLTFNTTTTTKIRVPYYVNSTQGINNFMVYTKPELSFDKTTNYSEWFYSNSWTDFYIVNNTEETQMPHCSVNLTNYQCQSVWTGYNVSLSFDGTGNDFTGLNNATLTGASYDAGVFDKALNTAGNDGSYAEITDSATTDFSGDSITIENWIMFDAFPAGWGTTLSKYAGGGALAEFFLGHNAGPGPVIIWGNGADIQVYSGTTTFQTGVWYYLVAVCDVAAGKSRIYVNGTLESEENYACSLPNTAANIRIGRAVEANEYIDGSIDEVRIQNRAVTSDEVLASYQQGIRRHSELGGTEIQAISKCQFQGRLKDSDGTTDINGGSIVIINQTDNKRVTNLTTNTTGGWAYNITLAGNYTVFAYNPSDKTKDADTDPFIECIPT